MANSCLPIHNFEFRGYFMNSIKSDQYLSSITHALHTAQMGL